MNQCMPNSHDMLASHKENRLIGKQFIRKFIALFLIVPFFLGAFTAREMPVPSDVQTASQENSPYSDTEPDCLNPGSGCGITVN